jgi:hypothetical protein
MAGRRVAVRGTRSAGAGLIAGALLATMGACVSPRPDSRPDVPPPVYPYLEVSSEAPQDLAGVLGESRVSGLTLAFVVAGADCRPVWSRGGRDATHAEVRSRVEALQGSRTPLRISFGGAGGTDLASRCGSANELAAAYRTVVDTYGPTSIDLDVEGRALADRAGNARRVDAIRAVQQAAATGGRPLEVSYTLPADRDGVPASGIRLLEDSVSAGIVITAVNVMVMDYGWGVTRLAAEAERQAMLAHNLVRRLWPHLSDRDAWHRVALTAMIGRNDVPGEVFHLADARALVRFAADRGVGWLSYWSMERDRPCPQPLVDQPTWHCSGISQRPYEFAEIFTSRDR